MSKMILIDEATVKLALEALENGKRVRNAEGGTKYQPDIEDKAITDLREALEEQPAQQEQESWEDLHNALQRIDTAAVGLPTFEVLHEGGLDAVTQNIVDAITALHTQPAQQEPVACVQDLDEVKRKHLVYEKGMDWKDPLYTSPQPAQPSKPIGKLCVIKDVSGDYGYTYDISTDDAGHDALRGMDGAMLYTSPPAQRTWVGLTDEEMQDLWDRYAHMEMMRAIEAKLREKNQ